MRIPDWLIPPYWMFQAWDSLRTVQTGRWVAGTLSFLMFISVGFGWTTLRDSKGLNEIRHVEALVAMPVSGPPPVLTISTEIGSTTTASGTAAPASKSPAPAIPGDTYLVAGVDSRAGADGKLGAGTTTTVEGSRSDTIALVRVADNGIPKIISIPRDSGVYRPACRRWDPTSSHYSPEMAPAADNVKINSTYAIGGPQCLVAAVQQLTGVKVDKFVGVDFAGMINLVNSVGGVDISTPYPIVDDELGVIIATPGPHHLNGRTALAYARARKVAQEGRNDYGRIKRQQRLVQALVDNVKAQIIRDPSRLNELAESFTGSIFGDNVNIEDLLTQLQNLTGGQYQTAPTIGTDDTGNEIVDRAALGTVLQRIWGGTVTSSPAVAPSPMPPTDPQQLAPPS